MTDLFTVQFSSIIPEQLYAGIADFAQSQPNESNRHDFKAVWTADTVKDVAGFANTFGGLLIIGVEKGQKDPQPALVGVPSALELTTGIASSIASNISPTPSYDIAECHKPGDPKRKFCVVRVRGDSNLHLVTKKGMQAVWVRNADQTIPADASQLRGLIDRERQIAGDINDALTTRGEAILEDMVIGQNYLDDPNWTAGRWEPSQTFFKLALIPSEPRQVRLDLGDEEKFTALIQASYRRLTSNLGRVARDARERNADFYEYRWYHNNLDYEGRWRVTNRLEIAHATQIKDGDGWSLTDVVMYAVLLLRIGATWWRAWNYFGDGILLAELNVPELWLRQGKAGQFIPLFNPAGGDRAMGPQDLVVHQRQRDQAKSSIVVNSATILNNIPEVVTSIMNPLLRSLGHGVSWKEFENGVRIIVEGQAG